MREGGGVCGAPGVSTDQYAFASNWGKSGRSDHPVNGVNWNHAKSYCEWSGGRLPTEAEWEYAARGGREAEKYPWGNQWVCGKANFCDSNCGESWKDGTCNDGYKGTGRVGSYDPNGYGLYDMAGNVFEWCSDWYGEKYYGSSPSSNPHGPSTGAYRVLRCGSRFDGPRFLRSTYRFDGSPGYRIYANQPRRSLRRVN